MADPWATVDLADDDIRNLAAQLAAQKPPPSGGAGAAEPAMFSVGQRLAQANRCASCHEDDCAGDQAAPRVGGQREDCLPKALRDFKSGVHAGGRPGLPARR